MPFNPFQAQERKLKKNGLAKQNFIQQFNGHELFAEEESRLCLWNSFWNT